MISTIVKFGEVSNLLSLSKQQTDKVAFTNVFENQNGGVSVLDFKAGQTLGTHLAPAEVMVYVPIGEIKFTMLDKTYSLHTGEFLLMGNDVPHSVEAVADSKVVLVKIKP